MQDFATIYFGVKLNYFDMIYFAFLFNVKVVYTADIDNRSTWLAKIVVKFNLIYV